MAMTSSVTSLSQPLFLRSKLINSNKHHQILVRFQTSPRRYDRLLASRRISNFSQSQNNSGREVTDPRNWNGVNNIRNYDYDDDDDDDDEEEDRSLDLLVRFVQNMFRKISKRARKAVRSVLPTSISTKLVGFSVNGVIILAFLWIMKAFLEVVCTLGSMVFVSILLIRGIWSGVTYIQENRYPKNNGFEDKRSAWTGAQPAF